MSTLIYRVPDQGEVREPPPKGTDHRSKNIRLSIFSSLTNGSQCNFAAA